MNETENLNNYLDLLIIRQTGRKREVRIIGAICLIFILFSLGYGLVTGLAGREVYLVAGLNLGLVITFLMSWARLEVTTQIIELLQHR